MKVADVLPQLQKRLRAKVPGRKTYVVTGRPRDLAEFRKKLRDLVAGGGYPQVKCLSLNDDFLAYLKDKGVLEMLIQDERALRKQSVQTKLQKRLKEFLTSALKAHGLLGLHDFELVFGYRLELEFLWEWAVNGRQIVFLVPGEQHHDDVIAYAWQQEYRRTFPRNLVKPEWTWVLGEESRDNE